MGVIICCNQSSDRQGLITVQGVPPNQWEPEIDLESHKTGDVEIYRVIWWEKGYTIVFYHDISGNLRSYHYYYYDTTNFDQGFYDWKNDTTVTVKIYNSETKQEYNVELFATRDTTASAGVRLLE